MTTSIRVGDWTKEELEEIRDDEDHSSHDSVIKTLLKEREATQIARSIKADSDEEESWEPPSGKRYDALTVMNEAGPTDRGEASLWCPNCGREVMYLFVDDLRTIGNVHIDCQDCDVELGTSTLVYLDEGEWLDEHPDAESRQPKLKRAVIDYWERRLDDVNLYEYDGYETTGQSLASSFWRSATDFGWNWRPRDVPTKAISLWNEIPSGQVVFRNTRDEEFLIFLDWGDYNEDSFNDIHAWKWDTDQDREDGELTVVPRDKLNELVENWKLFQTYPEDLELPQPAREVVENRSSHL